MNKNVRLIIGLVCGVLVIILLNVYLMQERGKSEDILREEFNKRYKTLTSTLIAKQDIHVGAVIDADMVTTQVVPQEFVQPQAQSSLDRISGMKVSAPIKKGEQISLTKLIPINAQGRSLAMSTPVGKRAVSLHADTSLTKMLTPGDYVDLVGSLPIPTRANGKVVMQDNTVTLFQNVLLLAVGDEVAGAVKNKNILNKMSKKKKSKGDSSLITVALTAREASILSFAKDKGKVIAVLRSPADANIEKVSPANWDTFIQHVQSMMPPTNAPRPAPAAAPAAEKRKIEIYRGAEKGYVEVTE